MLGKVLEVLVCATFSNHIYSNRNELYKQLKGGAIGLRLTAGIVARIVIDQWTKIFRERLRQAEEQFHMLKKYVNYIKVIMRE